MPNRGRQIRFTISQKERDVLMKLAEKNYRSLSGQAHYMLIEKLINMKLMTQEDIDNEKGEW